MKDILLSDNPLAYRMESLESKLGRLSPDQRKEVEDFLDFLMFRSGNSHESPGTAPVSLQPQKVAPPPLTLQEPVHVTENPPPKIYDLARVENSSIPVRNEEQISPLQEFTIGGDDRITRDYMDYGQYEQQLSPAIIAVKNVKEKLKKQEENQKPRELLDWID
jgi:hypothetical protein